jgi:hypothetical protein
MHLASMNAEQARVEQWGRQFNKLELFGPVAAGRHHYF